MAITSPIHFHPTDIVLTDEQAESLAKQATPSEQSLWGHGQWSCPFNMFITQATSVIQGAPYVMPAWYDIISLDKNNREVDTAGIVKSRQQIRDLIKREEERGIPSHRIFLVGFSQGSAVAYTAGLTHPEPLAGIIAMSTYLPVPELVTEEATEANRQVPIFAAHGTEDDVVLIELGLRAREYLQKNGYACQWQEYPMPHSICIEEIQAIGTWLNHQIVGR